MRVLIVEDDPGTAGLIKECLSTITDDIVIAATREQALAEIAKAPLFDVVTLDLCLPDSPPRETLLKIQDIKRRNPNCVLIVVTGYAHDEVVRMGEEHQFEAYLEKSKMAVSSGGFMQTLRDTVMSIIRQPVHYKKSTELLHRLSQLTPSKTPPL